MVPALALDLLKGLLTFNPDSRITVEEALRHPFLEQYHDPSDEPKAERPFDIDMENDDLPMVDLKKQLFAVIQEFRADHR